MRKAIGRIWRCKIEFPVDREHELAFVLEDFSPNTKRIAVVLYVYLIFFAVMQWFN